jgi:signal transduction histidine kinase
LRFETDRCGEAELVVRVIDSGRGIKPAGIVHLFEPFYSTKEKGLGIGLAISRSIVEAHGGKLTYSVNRDEETVFAFTLPVIADHSLL